MGTGFLKRKKEAKMLQQQLSAMRDKLDASEAEGQAGNGLVKVVLKGDFTIKSLQIKPECVDKDDIEGLQDLIKAAFNDAKKKLDSDTSTGMPSIPGFPGF